MMDATPSEEIASDIPALAAVRRVAQIGGGS